MDQLIDEILTKHFNHLKEGNPKNKEEACPGIVKNLRVFKRRLRLYSRDDLEPLQLHNKTHS